MKRRIVGAACAALLAYGVCGSALAQESLLLKHCSESSSDALTLARQVDYWDDSEGKRSVTDTSKLLVKTKWDLWFFDRFTFETGYYLNGVYKLNEGPGDWAREDKPLVSLKFTAPFTMFKALDQQRALKAAADAKSDIEEASRRAKFFNSFLDFTANLSSSDAEKRRLAVKQAVEIGAISPAFANECLHPALRWDRPRTE